MPPVTVNPLLPDREAGMARAWKPFLLSREMILPGLRSPAVAINAMEKTDEDRVFEQGL
jgi:hypothetical protein